MLLPGVLVAVGVSAACLALTRAVPVLPGLLVAILLGAVARSAGLLPAALEPGLAWTGRRVLRAGVVLLGLQLSVGDLLGLGVAEAAVLLVTVAATFAATRWLGPRLGVGRALTLLVATGFSICGAAAVAAMSPVADADEEEVATAVALVTVYGSLAIVGVPLAAAALGLSDRTAGLWAGMSVHEVAQVVAAAGTVSAAALSVAVVAKLARVVLLAPLVAGVGVARRASAPPDAGRPGAGRPPLVPLFVVGFVVAVAVRSSGVLPDAVLPAVKPVTTLLLGAAMTALGTQIHLGRLVRTGGRPLALGAASTLVAATVSLAGLVLVA
ncbi:YeiH family protein [Cellulomonas endometrii]|uniref:YeiH family protein n=1 Tax=Cellulomonas endometrii TaxID=3036301 RepID=UPI0024AE0D9A|nr:putative sulfate exporter family transporter [Cellulomonas endometrii]